MPTTPRCNCLTLRQATRWVTQLYDRALAPLALRATQFPLLTRIADLGPIALNQLADAMVIDRATLGHNVRPLEARALGHLAAGRDRRSHEVSITAKGRQLIRDARPMWEQAQRSFETELGQQEASALGSGTELGVGISIGFGKLAQNEGRLMTRASWTVLVEAK